LLEGESCDVNIRDYLNEPPSVTELQELLVLLGCKAEEIVRKDEPIFKALKKQPSTELGFLKLMSKHPILIQRPIVVDGEKAIIGRPPLLVLDLIPKKKKTKKKSSL
jgi:arsenate reductase